MEKIISIRLGFPKIISLRVMPVNYSGSMMKPGVVVKANTNH